MLESLRRRAPIERAAPSLWEANEWLTEFPTGNPVLTGDYQALALPAFWRGVNLRTSVLSTLPLWAQVDGRTVGVNPPIVEQPDPTEDRQVTLTRLAASLVLRGEYVAVLGSFDGDGFPQALKVIDPAMAQLELDGTWTINGQRYSRDEVLHRPSFILPGELRGISVVELFRRVLEGEAAAQQFQRQFYLDGAPPTAVVTVNKPDLQPKDLDLFKKTWTEKLRGRREPVFVPGDTSVSMLPLSHRDAQYLESRQFALTDIANIVGLPPYFVGSPGSNNTYANLSDQRRDLIDLYLRGDVYSLERGFSSLVPDGVAVRYDSSSFLRLDPKGTADTLAVESQWMTVDEIRAVQGLDPLPDGAGKVLGSLVLPGAPAAPAPSDPATGGGPDA